ncbi:MAG: hypothetical protein ACYTGC_07345, partial [Planctomycetota bacterium]
TGVEWSGVSRGEDSVFVISNLGNEPALVDLPPLPGVPAVSPTVQPGEHVVLLYDNGTPLDCGNDCNGNGQPDTWEILLGEVEDCDFDGIPDECSLCCPADITGDGSVDVDDLLQLLIFWGQRYTAGDVNVDSYVGVDDLLVVIQGWGSCL